MNKTQKQSKKTITARVATPRPTSVRAKSTKKTSVKHRVKHHAKKILVPHKINNFRPHLIRLPGLAAIFAIAISSQLVYSFITTGHLNVLGRVSDISAVELLNDTNKERDINGVGSLQLSDKLSQAAFLRAQDMFEKDYWAHTSPSGVQPWKWFADVGYNYSYAGENLAKNYPNADSTVSAWMGSESHKENVLNSRYTEVGFAVVDGELDGQSTTLVVALYGTPVTVAALESVTAQSSSFAAPTGAVGGSRPLEYFGNALQSLSPVTIAILGVFALVAIVGVAAHHYRDKLPKAWRQSWKIHHGMYTFVGMLVLGVLIIVATGGGQI